MVGILNINNKQLVMSNDNHSQIDMGKWSVKKISSVNLKKILLFEREANIELKHKSNSCEFRIFREQK
ncbi:hypothetical protein EG348_10430 [Chryseobacterium sp. G0201]|nr:hypothetical protein EG348_10430 [Chryseobacterium sp. G0201]